MKLTAKYAMVVLDLAGDDKPLIDVYPQPPEGSNQPRKVRPMTIEVSYAPDKGDAGPDWIVHQVVVTGAPEDEEEWKTFVRTAWLHEQLEHLPSELLDVVKSFAPVGLSDVVVEFGRPELTDEQLVDLLLLVGVSPSAAQLSAWSPEQREQAADWAAAAHLDASDNEVVVPPRPEFLS